MMGLVSATSASTANVATEVTCAENNLRKFSTRHEWDPNLPGMCVLCYSNIFNVKIGCTYIYV